MMNDHVKLIRRALGDQAERIECIEEGWDSIVYVVNEGEWVWKFPRSETIRKQYDIEKSAYRWLETITAVDTPVIAKEHSQNDFLAYRGIQGKQLETHLADLDEKTKYDIGAALGSFLIELHRMEPYGVTKYSVRQEIAELQQKFLLARDALREHFSVGQLRVLEDFFYDEFPAAMDHGEQRYTLCHGDLSYRHIFFNEKSKRCGVIDFGDLGYYESSIDFCGLAEDAVIGQTALDVYGASDTVRGRARLRAKVSPVLDIPYYVKKQDAAGIALCVRRAKAAFALT